MMKFDNAKYRTVLNLIKKTGEFKGKAVPSKARLHEMIGDALGISHNTVKDWERATSNGPDPRIPGLLEQLEAYLELPEGGLRERTAEPIKLTEQLIFRNSRLWSAMKDSENLSATWILRMKTYITTFAI